MPDHFEAQRNVGAGNASTQVTGAGKLQHTLRTAHRHSSIAAVPRMKPITSSLSAVRLAPVYDAPAPAERSTEPLTVPHFPDLVRVRTEALETTEPRLPAVQTPHRIFSTRLSVGSGSDAGIRRRGRPNEDSILAIHGVRSHDAHSRPFGLFVVADGMGGHAHGQQASSMAIKTIGDVVISSALQDPGAEQSYAELLVEGTHRANRALYERNRQQQHLMGTTMTAALVMHNTAYIANVGDSRTYLYRSPSGLVQVTRDHSVVARMVEEKYIDPDDIYTHPRRNEIYRCLGSHEQVEVDSFAVPLQPGDSLLLCSDGLWEMVRDSYIEQILQYSSHQPAQASAFLIQAALNGGGKDNVSVVVVHVTPSYT